MRKGNMKQSILYLVVNMDVQSKVTLQTWEKFSAEHQKQYKNFLAKADKKEVLKEIPELHAKAFEQIDCLKCARCCKGFSPRFKGPDIKRISRVLGMKETALIGKYLVYDEEGDYVVVSKPCPFLEPDNTCRIYEDRPSDCRRFPYTDEDVILKRPQLTIKNSSFCPIVVSVMEGLLEKLT
jgi:Fe-S-cluster containining protein